MYRKLLAVMLALVFMVGVSGCVVTSSKYKRKEFEANQLAAEKDGLIQERDRLAQDKAALAKSAAGLEANLKTLETKNRALEDQNGALKADLADASKKYLLLEKETKELKEAIAAAEAQSVKSGKKPQQVFK